MTTTTATKPESQTATRPPIYSMRDLWGKYCDMVTSPLSRYVNLADWLPGLGQFVRPLVPGELAFIMADTGHCKSMALQNIAASLVDPVLFFELELPGTLMAERFMALHNSIPCLEVEQQAKQSKGMSLAHAGLDHIMVCDATRLSTETMKKMILEDAPKLQQGWKPTCVMVDYIGLMSSSAGGRSRYERVSVCAEDLKVLAKETDTVVIAATQVGRDKDRTDGELDLHSAKDSGSIEASCGLLLGLWRTSQEKLYVQVLKNTKGAAGQKIECHVDGARMTIVESRYRNENLVRDDDFTN